MNARKISLVGALALCLCACPPPAPTADAGFEDAGGGNNVTGPCTGGCGVNQKCDEVTHQCVDGCGGCDAGVCIKNATGAFQCVPTTTACNGAVCASGQAACVGGNCSCLTFTRASRDSCAVEGKICNEPYNPATSSGGTCDSPKMFEACKTTGCPSGNCAACGAGMLCQSVFGSSLDPVCTKSCTTNTDCNKGDFCSEVGCLPASLFGSKYGCANKVLLDAGLPDGGLDPDAGTVIVNVPVSNTCLLKDGNGVPTEAVATGNCTYDFFRFSNQLMTFDSCRAPGGATQNSSCKRDTSNATVALQCGTGLECAITRGDTGQCLKMCNAVPGRWGIIPQPSCATDEACVNLYRLQDANAVVGVCMKKCDVFSATLGTCADYGTAPASCVPVPADGQFLVSTDGTGVCVPQKQTVAAAGEPCAEVDAFKGAACASGLVCRAATGTDQPTCAQPCDVSCAVASPPARCATEPNATCSAGKTCTKVTSTTGATLGFCK